MFNCANNLYVDVRNYPNYAIVPPPSPTNANGTLNTGSYLFSPGGPGDIVIVRLIYQWPVIAAQIGFCNPGDIVVVRLIYQWPIIVPALAVGLVNSANNTNTLIATVAFRNEPYTSGP